MLNKVVPWKANKSSDFVTVENPKPTSIYVSLKLELSNDVITISENDNIMATIAVEQIVF